MSLQDKSGKGRRIREKKKGASLPMKECSLSFLITVKVEAERKEYPQTLSFFASNTDDARMEADEKIDYHMGVLYRNKFPQGEITLSDVALKYGQRFIPFDSGCGRKKKAYSWKKDIDYLGHEAVV